MRRFTRLSSITPNRRLGLGFRVYRNPKPLKPLNPKLFEPNVREEEAGPTDLHRISKGSMCPSSIYFGPKPQSTQIGTTLRPKYVYVGAWTLRES